MIIRQEQPEDYRVVEELTREAFWNLYIPGAVEHAIIHHLRESEEFIPSLSLVAVIDDQIVGHIAYSHSSVTDKQGNKTPLVTFAPLSVLPQWQGKGVGRQLISHSKEIVAQMGYKAIVIYGYPSYYEQFGFKSGIHYNISQADGRYPKALLVYELTEGALNGVSGVLSMSKIFDLGEKSIGKFEAGFPPKEKKITPSQATFMEMSNLFDD